MTRPDDPIHLDAVSSAPACADVSDGRPGLSSSSSTAAELDLGGLD
jgi:hypothetical protein